MPDWTIYDPQLRQFAADGVSPTAMAKRLGFARQTVVDRLRKLGLKAPKHAAQEMPMPHGQDGAEEAVELPGQMTIDADTPPHEPVLPIGNMVPVMGELVEPLSSSEAQTLAHYEAIIAQGLKVFVEVGQALLAIREQKLYREAFGTFEDYLRQRWDLSRSYAHRLIDAAEVTERLLPVGNILPVNEAQARPLASLPPEQQPTVWQEVVTTAPDGKITAKHVQQVVTRAKEQTPGAKGHTPKPHAPEPRPPVRKQVQDALTYSLKVIDDDEAWPVLAALWLGLEAHYHNNPNMTESALKVIVENFRLGQPWDASDKAPATE
jgi:hypothetical protein